MLGAVAVAERGFACVVRSRPRPLLSLLQPERLLQRKRLLFDLQLLSTGRHSMLSAFVRKIIPGRSATTVSIEDQQIGVMIARMKELGFNIPTTSRKFTMCEYRDRPPGDCGYAEGKVELGDGTRHTCSGSVIKGALNGFCCFTITTPQDNTPIEVSSIFTLGYAVGITHLQWPDGLLIQISLEDNLLVTSSHDRYIFASFPSADPPHAFQRPSNHEFVVFLEPPTLPLPGDSLGLNAKTMDISYSCRFAHALRSYAISCLETLGSRGILIVPEESASWTELVRQTGQELKDSQIRAKPDVTVPSTVASPTVSSTVAAKGLSSSEDYDFSLWCMILLELGSWQPQQKKRDDSNSGQADTVNDAWQLFDYKMADPFSLISRKVIRLRTSTYNVQQYVHQIESPSLNLESEQTESKAPDALTVMATKAKVEGPAVNLRCMPLLLRAMYTWQDKNVLSQNVVLKGSGYRILIKAARSIKERTDNATTLAEKSAAQKFRNETLPVLLRLLPHVLHQVQDEHWTSFSMSLEFAWWLSEIAPVQLNMSGLHVLGCACVLGCRSARCREDCALNWL